MRREKKGGEGINGKSNALLRHRIPTVRPDAITFEGYRGVYVNFQLFITVFVGTYLFVAIELIKLCFPRINLDFAVKI